LYVDEELVVFWFGWMYGGIFYVGMLGYDFVFVEYWFGIYILMCIIGEFCVDFVVGMIDYGFGDLEYKWCFLNVEWDEIDVFVFVLMFCSVRINFVWMVIVCGEFLV